MCFAFKDAVKIMAKDLVRTRRYVKKFILMKANLQAVSLKIQVGIFVILWNMLLLLVDRQYSFKQLPPYLFSLLVNGPLIRFCLLLIKPSLLVGLDCHQ